LGVERHYSGASLGSVARSGHFELSEDRKKISLPKPAFLLQNASVLQNQRISDVSRPLGGEEQLQRHHPESVEHLFYSLFHPVLVEVFGVVLHVSKKGFEDRVAFVYNPFH